ncbi:MAG: hypothetical protein MUD12_12460 [Spirochaetes bacterium]|jgi:hypothetical protein|nr:hypothetical protein [Spirochaetota bacterium]
MKRLFPLIILSLAILPLNGTEEPAVRIGILSKHLRLARNNGVPLVFVFDGSTPVRESGSGLQTGGGRLRIYFREGAWHAEINGRVFSGKFDFRADGGGPGVARIELKGGARSYRTPLTVRLDAGPDPVIITSERLSAYCMDAAVSEFGKTPPGGMEAVYALGAVISSRYRKIAPVHDGYDFCDLTHCQVYRGVSWNGPVPDCDMIEPAVLFFHSCCGGVTLDRGLFRLGSRPGDDGVRDRLFQTGRYLCRDGKSGWERTLPASELGGILGTKGKAAERILDVESRGAVIRIAMDNNKKDYASEDFRLRINRKRGWNFIKSNNYTVKKDHSSGDLKFVFSGMGLGHGVGLCQKGALALSSLGYGRYEILEHYHPGLKFRASEDGAASIYLSYVKFDLNSGRIIEASNPSMEKRRLPSGSIFKIIAALYLASERPDLFSGYRFSCGGKKGNNLLPEGCWKPGGHGDIGIEDALPSSCNMYFASLAGEISEEGFRAFFERFCGECGIEDNLPDGGDFSKILSGLDRRVFFSVGDLMKIAGFLHASGRDSGGEPKRIRREAARKVYGLLAKTFIMGTASGAVKEYGDPRNYLPLQKKPVRTNMEETWGKTSTVIDGTNRPVSYGIFFGGRGETGIITVLRKGNGHLAAKWALEILNKGAPNN